MQKRLWMEYSGSTSWRGRARGGVRQGTVASAWRAAVPNVLGAQSLSLQQQHHCPELGPSAGQFSSSWYQSHALYPVPNGHRTSAPYLPEEAAVSGSCPWVTTGKMGEAVQPCDVGPEAGPLGRNTDGGCSDPTAALLLVFCPLCTLLGELTAYSQPVHFRQTQGGWEKAEKEHLPGGGWIRRNPRERTCRDDKRGNVSPREEGHSPGQEGSHGGR